MNADLHWDATRWREHDRSSQMPAPTPRSTEDAKGLLLQYDQPLWERHTQQPVVASAYGGYAPLPVSATAAPHRRPGDTPETFMRHTTPGPGATPRPQHELAFTSPHHANSRQQGLRGSSIDDSRPRESAPQGPEPPPALHIPKNAELPRISPAYGAPSHRAQSHGTAPPSRSQSQSTLLPSFASLRQTSGNDDLDEPVIAPMSERLTCNSCTKLRPLIHDVSLAVAELDETVQTHCHRSVNRTPDIPRDSDVRTAQWILDRLRYARNDLRDAGARTFSGHPQQGQLHHHNAGFATQIQSPPGSLKRPSEYAETDDMSVIKRQRSGSTTEGAYRTYSPVGTDSLPTSAHPHAQSPSMQGRSLRPLPSPSSLAYQPSVAHSVAGHGPQSMSSPTSYHPGSSIHTATTSSAASQHIADLQHQVTLKSLALQTLQSEYASLLQKLQRERLKSQAIEKKTNVADLEVNDLTTRNEELTEQVKSLETQVEEIERRREAERADATKEKDQWGRMLDMSGRLQAKNAEERQRLLDEKNSLEQRVLAYERDSEARFLQMKKNMGDRFGSPRKGSPAPQTEPAKAVVGSRESALVENQASEALQRENLLLRARLDVMRSALDDIRRQNNATEDREREVAKQRSGMKEAIDHALHEDERLGRPRHPETRLQRSPRPRQTTTQAPPPAAAKQPASHTTYPTLQISSSPPPPEAPTAAKPFRAPLPSPETMRAVSPGPAELGFDVTPSNASPEDLIKALGPVPTSKSTLDKLNIPAWNPPAAFNKRDASGPGTPYPGTETSGPTPVRQQKAKASVSRSGSKSRRASPEKRTPGVVGDDSGPRPTRNEPESPAAAAMPPPPPRPAAQQAANWRPLE